MNKHALQARIDQLQIVSDHLQQMAANMDRATTPEGRLKATATILRAGMAVVQGQLSPERTAEIEAKIRQMPLPLLLAAIAGQKLQSLQWQLNSGDLETIEETDAAALAETSLRNAIIATTF